MNNYIYIYLIAITLLNIYLLIKYNRLKFSLELFNKSLIEICIQIMKINKNQEILKGKEND